MCSVLGLGTVIGWKRIVITVGEKIGKSHLTYAQGPRPRWWRPARSTGGDMLGPRVSTTYVLSSGVVGTMVANGWATYRLVMLARCG